MCLYIYDKTLVLKVTCLFGSIGIRQDLDLGASDCRRTRHVWHIASTKWCRTIREACSWIWKELALVDCT